MFPEVKNPTVFRCLILRLISSGCSEPGAAESAKEPPNASDWFEFPCHITPPSPIFVRPSDPADRQTVDKGDQQRRLVTMDPGGSFLPNFTTLPLPPSRVKAHRSPHGVQLSATPGDWSQSVPHQCIMPCPALPPCIPRTAGINHASWGYGDMSSGPALSLRWHYSTLLHNPQTLSPVVDSSRMFVCPCQTRPL